jgi:diguanylate cyclase (GGDEF)-like protein
MTSDPAMSGSVVGADDPVPHRREEPGGSEDAYLARHQRLRLQRVKVASINYALYCALSAYFVVTGSIALPIATITTMIVIVIFVNAGFIAAISSGYNLRLKDPSMTREQLIVSFLFALVLFAFCRTTFAQNICILAFGLSIFFGAIGLGIKQLTALSLPAFAGFAAITLWNYVWVSGALEIGIARTVIYSLLFAWFVFFSSYIGRLREQLSARNRELRDAMARIEELAIKDELTGTFNRRFVRQALANEIARADRGDAKVSICMLDVDRFKRINDTHGHPVGDEVLKELVKCVEQSVRRVDKVGHHGTVETLGRLGGEEFLLVLPATSREGARVCAERICCAVTEQPLVTGKGPFAITLSVGIAEYRAGDTLDSIIARADDALYRAKAGGRNRIEA